MPPRNFIVSISQRLRQLVSLLKAKQAGFRQELYTWYDSRLYRKNLGSFRQILKDLPPPANGSLLIVSGRGMNVLWAQIWTILSIAVRVHGYRGLVLTTRSQKHLNRYFQLLGLGLLYLDVLMNRSSSGLPEEVARFLAKASTFEEFRDFVFQSAPIGQIALSTYSRYHGTGIINLADPAVLESVKGWVVTICQAMGIADSIYEQYKVRYVFFTEVFMEEYGAFYYAALAKGLNITRFAGTVRDDAIIAQHLTKTNDRIHHSSLSPASWDTIKGEPFTAQMDAELTQNFLDRYGDKWHRSKRNQPNTTIMPVEEARHVLGISPGRKAAVIYSHILYDTLFFFGTDLFNDYAEWLVETVRVACQNPMLDWLVKVHPSNLWRGELDSLLKGQYEEERLLRQALGKLPPHVRIVLADTPINPYAWFQLADYGITVRGTAGLEMAALGKTAIMAGTGRYEGNGFTIDPKDKAAYLECLRKLPNIPSLGPEQVELAKKYAYAIFILKPFTLHCLKPRLKTGVTEMRDSDDLLYYAEAIGGNGLPDDLQQLSKWIVDPQNLDLLSA